jgi:DtxR family transcriptional regulator, Mn-dependent transcriptional regulator
MACGAYTTERCMLLRKNHTDRAGFRAAYPVDVIHSIFCTVKVDFAGVHAKFPAAAEYLSSIYILRRDYGHVSNTRLAEWSGVSSSAVTQALGRLKRLGLARQEPYGDIELTDEGREFAVRVLRRHYLLEHLLVRVLGYPWDKADDEAKTLQSAISDDLAEHLYLKLGAPQTCPHGNPMPESPLESRLLTAPRLSDAPTGSKVRILRITEEGEQLPSMLEFCFAHGIRPGAAFVIAARGELAMDIQDTAAEGGTGIVFSIETARAFHIRYEGSAAPQS